MDLNLILSAQSLCLAPQLQRSGQINGLLVIKNVPAKTYLRVTPEEWMVLQQFETPHTVPTVLGSAIRDRYCLPLRVFYEVILKARRANILQEPGVEPETVRAYDWHWAIHPKVLKPPLVILFCAGIVMAFSFQPRFPSSPLDWTAGLLLLSASLSFGNFLAACLIRGANGEVYRPHWRWLAVPPHFAMDTNDAIMLPFSEQMTVGLACSAVLAIAVGVTALNEPKWAFFSLLGLIVSLRPVLGGRLPALIRVGRKQRLSDSEQNFVFPLNRRPEVWGRLLNRLLSDPTTWARIAYGVVWTFAILYWGARLEDIPPWALAFLAAKGILIALGIGGLLALLGAGCFAWEFFDLAYKSALAWRDALRLWKRRWFGGGEMILDESSRVKAMAASPLFSTLAPPLLQEVARAMAVRRHGPWKALPENGNVSTQVSMIVSGKVSLRRETPAGRTVQVQVLSEGDIIGLHDLADPEFPIYHLRTLTPVTLLTMDRTTAEELVIPKFPKSTLIDTLLKMPFLQRISLCRNWHLQAIRHFARLSSIINFSRGAPILSDGHPVDDFFVIFQGDARVIRNKRQLAVIRAGEFFGEIGLMQNSCPNASVIANNGTRCLRIPRTELLRFVTHNYTVALEIERMSSERLGRPLFPLSLGDFCSN